MNSTPLLQQYPACLVRLTGIVFAMGGRWPYSCYFMGCCLQDLFNIARCILVYLPSSFFSIRLVSVHVVHPYISFDTTTAWSFRECGVPHSGLLWPGVVVPDRVLSMGKIELICVLMLNWITWNRSVLTYKQSTYAKLNWIKMEQFYMLNRIV